MQYLKYISILKTFLPILIDNVILIVFYLCIENKISIFENDFNGILSQ